ncbi:MAG TPA: response regulator [Flavobacterium sp.]|jgi:response regulator RpfG family c-di-GMP phosphodiesterase
MVSSAAPIFYVDDDTDDLELFLEVSRTLELEVLLFSRGDKMLKTLLNPPPKPSIVFVDLNMPEISGYEVIENIKTSEFLNDIPIVVLSTASDSGSVFKSRKSGASYYIKKPTSVNQLEQAIKHVMGIDWNKHDCNKHFVHPE